MVLEDRVVITTGKRESSEKEIKFYFFILGNLSNFHCSFVKIHPLHLVLVHILQERKELVEITILAIYEDVREKPTILQKSP